MFEHDAGGSAPRPTPPLPPLCAQTLRASERRAGPVHDRPRARAACAMHATWRVRAGAGRRLASGVIVPLCSTANGKLVQATCSVEERQAAETRFSVSCMDLRRGHVAAAAVATWDSSLRRQDSSAAGLRAAAGGAEGERGGRTTWRAAAPGASRGRRRPRGCGHRAAVRARGRPCGSCGSCD